MSTTTKFLDCSKLNNLKSPATAVKKENGNNGEGDADDVDGDETPRLAVEVHYLPFKVEFEGSANVKENFTDCVEPHKEIPDVKTNYFRCRPLTGRSLEIDANYCGLVVSDVNPATSSMSISLADRNGARANGGGSGSGSSKDKTRTLHVVNRFDKLTYWNWDKTPSSMDSPVKLQDWLRLSQILHEPIAK